MTDKEKIRAEVVNWIDNYERMLRKIGNPVGYWELTVMALRERIRALEIILSKIDHLPKE